MSQLTYVPGRLSVVKPGSKWLYLHRRIVFIYAASGVDEVIACWRG